MNFKTLSIVIVAEDALLAEALAAQFLQSSGFTVTQLTPTELADAEPDVFYGLDLVLLSGAESLSGFVEMLRGKSYRGPVLALTASEITGPGVESLAVPVRYPVLEQKIRSFAVSFWFRDDTTIEIGPMRLRPAFKEVLRHDGPPITLTEREVEILIYLYRAGGKIVSREVLLAEIWGYNAEVSTHTLETHIYRLRQKIETEPDLAGLLLTEAGGYRLLATAGV